LCAPGPPAEFPGEGRPLKVTVQSGFDFGRVARDDATTCELQVKPSGSASITQGDCHFFGGQDVGQFSVQGHHHRKFTFSTTWSGFTSTGVEMSNSDFSFDKSCASGCDIPGGAGTTRIQVGGDVTVHPDAALGNTNGSLDITVSYH
jgi:hypothetical protein